MWTTLARRTRIPNLARHIPIFCVTPRNYSTMAAETISNNETSTPEVEKKELPKLTAAEFRHYNRMSEHMNYFHSRFRQQWNTMSSACENGRKPQGMSLRQFLLFGLQFCSHLEGHHGIEEAHIFPVLATRMPSFKKELELLSQHKVIHAGLVKLQKYLDDCRGGEKDFRFEEMKLIMNSFEKTLWEHLDDEVKELGAENMRKYWTIEEMKSMPM